MRTHRCFQPRIFGIVALIVAAGCVGRGGASDPFAGPEKAQIVIEVDNTGFNQATVWILTGAGERRLGIVNGKATKSFTVRWHRSDELQVRVRVLGGTEFTTRRQLVFPGGEVELRIR